MKEEKKRREKNDQILMYGYFFSTKRRAREKKYRNRNCTLKNAFCFFQQHRFRMALFDVPLVVLADELTNLFGSILSTIIDRQSKLDTVDVE